jgi:hypothetical protein
MMLDMGHCSHHIMEFNAQFPLYAVDNLGKNLQIASHRLVLVSLDLTTPLPLHNRFGPYNRTRLSFILY